MSDEPTSPNEDAPAADDDLGDIEPFRRFSPNNTMRFVESVPLTEAEQSEVEQALTLS